MKINFDAIKALWAAHHDRHRDNADDQRPTASGTSENITLGAVCWLVFVIALIVYAHFAGHFQ